MRISTNQIFQQGIEAFGTQQSKISRLQEQISSGTRLIRPSDDPVASTKVLELEQLVAEQQQYQRNIGQAEQRLRINESTLTGVGNVLQRVRELVLQANSGVNSQQSLNAIAVEVEERLQELLSSANTVDPKGDYLFAGFQNQGQPFTAVATGSIEHVSFSGDEGQRNLQVSRSRQVNVNVSGVDVFLRIASGSAINQANTVSGALTMAPARVFDEQNYVAGDYRIDITSPTTYDVFDIGAGANIVTGATYTAGEPIEFQGIRTSIVGTAAGGESFTIGQGQFRDLFEVIQTFAETLRDGSLTGEQKAANHARSIEDIDNAIGQLLDARTSIGGRLNVLETQREDGDAFVLATQTVLSDLRDTDLAEAISQLTLEQTILEAAQGVFTRITRSTLFDFLR